MTHIYINHLDNDLQHLILFQERASKGVITGDLVKSF